MKKLIHSILLLTIISFSLSILVSCKKSGASENKEKAIVTNESTTSPDETSDEENDETADKSDTNEANADKTTNEDANTANSSSNQNATTAPEKKVTATAKANTSSSNTSVVFDDFLNPQEYKVTKTGTYTISCNPSDNKASWDIYVLDERFDDALRYLTSAYTPTAKAEANARTITLKEGQYLYAICSENSLTFEGDKSTFKCPLTIAAK